MRPLASGEKTRRSTTLQKSSDPLLIKEFGWALAIVAVIAGVCWGLSTITGYMFVALVFLLAVVLASLHLRRGPVILMAGLSAICWNYFFIPPLFTIHINKPEDWIMFGMFFIVALSMGSLTSRLRMREMAERRRLRQTDALLRVTQSAALAADSQKGLVESLRVINEFLGVQIALIVRNDDRSLPNVVHKASTFQPETKDWGVISWSYENKQSAGRFTDTLPESRATWFPLQTSTAMMGILGVQLPQDAHLDFNTRQTIGALTLQLALVLEKEHFIQAVSHAEVIEQSEKLQRTLLDSVSHELKTPLAVIHASLEGMADIIAEITMAFQRLQRVVEGLLHMTRLESEVLQPRIDWCDLYDVIAAARQAVGESLAAHPVRLFIPEDFPMIQADHHLLVQALANILHNSAIYTPAESAIDIHAMLENEMMRLTVHDHGAGLPAGEEHRIFDKFYRAKGAPAGGTGLGLAITRGFVQALGGHVTARNHPEGGAVFIIE